jgi:hypothetical protein
MIFVRALSLLLLISSGMCFAIYAFTSQVLWRDRGVKLLKVFVVVALIFFGVLAAERLFGI